MNMEPMGTEPEAEEDNQRSSWIEPLLDDSFYRAKRLQENGERQALKRKGDHYGEWRASWAANELPALFDEIISPAFEAVYRSQNLAEDKEMHIRISEISRRLIDHVGSIDDFTKIIIGELR
jgi:hypothetical protein